MGCSGQAIKWGQASQFCSSTAGRCKRDKQSTTQLSAKSPYLLLVIGTPIPLPDVTDIERTLRWLKAFGFRMTRKDI